MTRHANCGSTIVLPCNPAWSFPGKRPDEGVPPGPGPGKHGPADNWNSASTRFGGAPEPTLRPEQLSSAPYTASYLKPDYLSINPKGPAWPFGVRHRRADNTNPGPGAYGGPMGPYRQHHATMGPAPSRRIPAAAPAISDVGKDRRPVPPNSSLPGATFKGTWPVIKARSPGPAAYAPCCSDHCCDMCEKHRGTSFGIRHAKYVPPPHPGPNDYHIGCTTLGAAASGCSSGTMGSKSSYHTPSPSDHNYHTQTVYTRRADVPRQPRVRSATTPIAYTYRDHFSHSPDCPQVRAATADVGYPL